MIVDVGYQKSRNIRPIFMYNNYVAKLLGFFMRIGNFRSCFLIKLANLGYGNN